VATFKIEDNPFTSIYVDLTYKCNMNCHMCYNACNMNKEGIFEMDVDYFREVLDRLPPYPKLFFDFLGGEPTLHPKLHEFITIVNDHGHAACVQTNSLKFADPKFIEEIKTWKDPAAANKNPMYMGSEFPFSIVIDLGGGTKHNRFYKKLNNMECLEQKLLSLKNVIDIGISSIAVCATIIRNFNEEVIEEILELGNKHKEICVINFRNYTQCGKWEGFENKPYSVLELKELIRPFYPNMKKYHPPKRWLPNEDQTCYGCCYRFNDTDNMQRISLIDFGSETSAKCWKRGYLSNDSFELTNFFERIINEG
jgi:uncharacterized radical SAM superfamily Fe-S cluster-containing enzyme